MRNNWSNMLAQAVLTIILSAGISIGSEFLLHDYFRNHDAAREQAANDAKNAAFDQIRTDPAGCSRGIAVAGNLCGALANLDLAGQGILAWAEPADRIAIQAVLTDLHNAILADDSAPTWVNSLDWAESGATRRATALKKALDMLKSRPDGPDKTALSGKLATILREKLLQDSNTP